MQSHYRRRAATLWLQLLLIGGLASVGITVIQAYRGAAESRAVANIPSRNCRDCVAFTGSPSRSFHGA